MPAKGTTCKYSGRHTFVSKDLWKKYVALTNSTTSYKDFKAIILASLEETQRLVLREPVGFKLPFRIGNLAVNKFKIYGDFKCYSNVRTADDKPIKNFNLHTGGHTFRIQWFHNTRSSKERISFWHFDAERKFKRSLAKVLKSGKSPLYNTYMQDQFVTTR